MSELDCTYPVILSLTKFHYVARPLLYFLFISSPRVTQIIQLLTLFALLFLLNFQNMLYCAFWNFLVLHKDNFFKAELWLIIFSDVWKVGGVREKKLRDRRITQLVVNQAVKTAIYLIFYVRKKKIFVCVRNEKIIYFLLIFQW